jgi:hypothetical protein
MGICVFRKRLPRHDFTAFTALFLMRDARQTTRIHFLTTTRKKEKVVAQLFSNERAGFYQETFTTNALF